MPDRCLYDYAIIRVLPRVERDEFINAGVILSCPSKGFLEARIELDEQRLLALDAEAVAQLIRRHLAAIPMICAGGKGAGPLGQLSKRERFHWLVAARSTMVQPSPSHTGYCENPADALEHLMQLMVRR